MDGKRRSKCDLKLYSSSNLGYKQMKSDAFLPFLCPRGHQTAKQLMNVVALLWSQEALMGSFLLHKIKI